MMLNPEHIISPIPTPPPIFRRPMTRARITGSEIEIAKLFVASFVLVGETFDDSYFDFNAILPVPADLRPVWRGTDLRFQEIGADVLGITFRTAWNGVRPIFEEMRRVYPTLIVDMQWASPANAEAGIWHFGPDGVFGADCSLTDDIAEYVLDAGESYYTPKKSEKA